jgi:glutamyl-tRNA reductase
MSEVLAIGTSHKTAAVELRERIALSDGQAEAFLGDLVTDPSIAEAAAISTCNRTEIYLVTDDPVAAEAAALSKLAKRAGIRPTELTPAIYSLRNCDGARHLFRVGAGLESMVIGEAEVLGQLRRSYDLALDAGTTGPLLNRLFHSALRAGKRVRSETAIGERSLSVSTVAASLAKELLGNLEGVRVVILGAGETAELAAKALTAHGAESVFVANRRRDRALALAQRFDGEAVTLDNLPDLLARADVVIGATSSPTPIVTAEALQIVVDQRLGIPLLLIDLAVPRDIAADCAEIAGVTVKDIDDLQAVVDRNRSVRAAEASRAEDIVEEEIEIFARWLATLDAVPTIADLQGHGRSVADSVLADNEGRWESLSPSDRERVSLIARTVAQRLLDAPTRQLRDLGGDGSHGRIERVREIFELDASGERQTEERGSQADVVPIQRRGGSNG